MRTLHAIQHQAVLTDIASVANPDLAPTAILQSDPRPRSKTVRACCVKQFDVLRSRRIFEGNPLHARRRNCQLLRFFCEQGRRPLLRLDRCDCWEPGNSVLEMRHLDARHSCDQRNFAARSTLKTRAFLKASIALRSFDRSASYNGPVINYWRLRRFSYRNYFGGGARMRPNRCAANSMIIRPAQNSSVGQRSRRLHNVRASAWHSRARRRRRVDC